MIRGQQIKECRCRPNDVGRGNQPYTLGPSLTRRVRIEFCSSRLGASPGLVMTGPGLAPKRLDFKSEIPES